MRKSGNLTVPRTIIREMRVKRKKEKYIHPLTQDSQLDDIRQSAEEKRQAIINCYSMLEWSFHYFSLRYPISDAVLQIFKTQKTYENFETIKNFSKKIGLGNIDNIYTEIFCRKRVKRWF